MSRRPDLVGFDTREVRETHISWVFLGEAEVFKLKKPVDLGFLDFSTLERRRAACEAELSLNRRLAPDVYREVVPLFAAGEGRLARSGSGQPVEWAVRMRRLPDDDRADGKLQRAELEIDDVDSIAELLARFHADARADAETGELGRPERVAHNVQENFAQVGDLPAEIVGLASALEIEVRQLDFLRTHAELFHARIAAGRVRDGHGDLRLEHVYLSRDGPPIVLDCIEFADRFRYADVCADVAFLSMDLARLGRSDLAERFIARYARASNDFQLYRLVDFYESYRAYVRAKIACIQLRAGVGGPEVEREARTCFLLALAAVRPPLVSPAVIAVGGLPGSGKSTIADQLSLALGGPVVEADRTRKHLLGVAPEASLRTAAWQGAYATDFTDRVYTELLLRAEPVLDSGRPIVLDASFRSKAFRAAAKDLASRHGVPFHFVECRATATVCRDRLAHRDPATTASDAGPGEYDVLASRYESPGELDPAEHLAIDTERSLEETVATVRRHVLGG